MAKATKQDTRRGRPRSYIKREPNGRACRTTLAKIAQAERDSRQGETDTVMSQPHRRDSVDPAHPWNGSSIGRFLLPRLAKDPETIQHIYNATQRYFVMFNRWQRAKSVAAAYREGRGWSGEDPTPDEQADHDRRIVILAKRLGEIKKACAGVRWNDKSKVEIIDPQGVDVWSIVHEAIMFGENENDEAEKMKWAKHGVDDDSIYAALYQLAVEMGMPVSKHPFSPSIRTP
jgi:hypothetical protein